MRKKIIFGLNFSVKIIHSILSDCFMHESLTHNKAEQFRKTSIIYDKIDQNNSFAKLKNATWLFSQISFIIQDLKFFQNWSVCYCVNIYGQRKSEIIQRIIFTEKFSLSWPNKQRVSHSIVTNNSVCKTLQAHSEQLNTSTDEEDQEAELKPFVWFKGRSWYWGMPRFPLCLTNGIRICRVSLKVMSSLHTVGVYEKPGPRAKTYISAVP